MDASQEVHDAARAVTQAASGSLAETLNAFVAKFVGWPFTCAPGVVVDAQGNRTDEMSCAVHTTPAYTDGPNAGAFPADGVAAVIEASETLGLAELRRAYARVAAAKRLRKKPAPKLKGNPTTTVTLGLILAQRSDLPIETLAEELDRLNQATPTKERPDMLVLASTGTINYAVQMPGESLTGDFLPPAEGALDAYTPAMYIVMVLRPAADYSLNKMIAFLLAHLEIFSPGAKLPRWIDVLNGVTSQVVTANGYQFNLRGELVPVPREFYNDRYLGPQPFVVEGPDGTPLATLQFLPWQDGGAILLYGKLPLDGLLIFLRRDALNRAGVVKTAKGQLSYVLPITAADFRRMLLRLQQRSNMRVKAADGGWIVKKIADEGSQSPFVARLMIGTMRLRDATISDPSVRDTFDKNYQFMMTSLFAARDAARALTRIWTAHSAKLASGEIVRIQGRSVHVDEDVDRELGQEADAFLNAATRTLKKGMQDVANVMGVNIGFLFQKQAAFEAGIAALEASDPALAAYLRQARTWSERLVNVRNAVEHEGWTLPHVAYTRTDGGVTAVEPIIDGQPASAFAAFILDRLACFVEEVTAHCLERKMPDRVTLTEVPRRERDADVPARFRPTLSVGGMPPWSIAYHAAPFDET